MIVLGQVPLSVSINENVDSSKPQLSEAVPPPAINVARVVNAGGILPLHSSFTFGGHVITGGVVSSMVIVCMHSPVLPQESAIA